MCLLQNGRFSFPHGCTGGWCHTFVEHAIYCASLVFDITSKIPTVRWSFLKAGFHLNPGVLLVHLIVTPAKVLDRIVISDLLLEDFVFSHVDEVGTAGERPGRQRSPIPEPTQFTMSLKTYIDKVTALYSCFPVRFNKGKLDIKPSLSSVRFHLPSRVL
jgi:hypothetical protein